VEQEEQGKQTNIRGLFMEKLECGRCGGSWSKRVDNPKRCPLCTSPYWNRPRVGHGVGSPSVYEWVPLKVGESVSIPFSVGPDGLPDDTKNKRRGYALTRYMRMTGKVFFAQGRGDKLFVQRVK